MPYITKERRAELDEGGPLGANRPGTAGELTYALTRALNDYLADAVERNGALRFANLSECAAALDVARADFNRRVLEPYEFGRQLANGDVWSPHVVEAVGR